MTTTLPPEIPVIESFLLDPAPVAEAPAIQIRNPEMRHQIHGYLATAGLDLGGFLDELCG